MPLILKKTTHPEPSFMIKADLWTHVQQECQEKEGVELLMLVEKFNTGQRNAITTAIILKNERPQFAQIISLPERSFFMTSGLATTLSSTPSGISFEHLKKIWPETTDDWQQFWHMPEGVVVLPNNPFWLENKMSDADRGQNAHIGGLFYRPSEGSHHERMKLENNIEQMRFYVEQLFQTPNHTNSRIVLT